MIVVKVDNDSMVVDDSNDSTWLINGYHHL